MLEVPTLQASVSLDRPLFHWYLGPSGSPGSHIVSVDSLSLPNNRSVSVKANQSGSICGDSCIRSLHQISASNWRQELSSCNGRVQQAAIHNVGFGWDDEFVTRVRYSALIED